jgi:tRNA1(Val) A37 N6-methylase TrmN6
MASAQFLDECCQAVASELADRRFNLINNGCPGVPDKTMAHFMTSPKRGKCIEFSVLRSPFDTSSRHGVAPEGFPFRGDITMFCDIPFELLSAINSRAADLVVVIGGGLGTLFEVAACVMQDLPVICYHPSGGASGIIQPLFESFRSRYKRLDVQSVDTVGELARVLDQFVSRFQEANRPTKLAPILDDIERALQQNAQTMSVEIDGDLGSVRHTHEHYSVQQKPPMLISPTLQRPDCTVDEFHLRHAQSESGRVFRYDGIEVAMTRTQLGAMWGPSIDTFILLSVLQSLTRSGEFASALDVGCGSGILALWLAGTRRASRVYGIDSSAKSVLCAQSNLARQSDDLPCTFIQADLEAWELPGAAFDLVVSNPPSIAIPPPLARHSTAFGGTALLRNLLGRLDGLVRAGGQCIVAISRSALLDKAVSDLLRSRAEAGGAEIVGTREVPFNVSKVIVDDEWIEALIATGAVKRRKVGEYHYQHIIDVWRIHV